ncbi:MAG: outer membrane beta-barrel protein [Flavobacteriales bacterium]|nr:outer membrane beta-barrel protein [Flavobacteriales bacterium]MEB2341436.1 TonB-dependent receptor [Flavobacteriia bacterium]
MAPAVDHKQRHAPAGTVRRILGLLAFLLFHQLVMGQAFTLSGTVYDKGDGHTMPGAALILIDQGDTTLRRAAVSDKDGGFQFSAVAPGRYVLRASFIGFRTIDLPLQVEGNMQEVKLRMEASVTELQAVEKVAVQRRAEQQGDTTVFNAAAYKVNPDATAEDLLTKMPGITSDKDGVKAQGEKVTKVLLDGEEFFGNDATTVLKTLPAEVVEKVQVFDKLSDQAQFSGFDDGSTDKTINIITRSGMNHGMFGTASVGYGTDDRHAASLSFHRFKGKQRISLIGQSNNVNQQNFSAQDLAGVSAGAFTVGNKPGIIRTRAIGLNYSNDFGRTKITGSYFFNQQHGLSTSLSDRTTYFSNIAAQVAHSSSERATDNANHRLIFRIKTDLDDANSLIIRPQLSLQPGTTNSLRTSRVLNGEGALLSASDNDNRSDRENLSFSNSLLFRHKFALKGRTFSANLSTSLGSQDGTGGLLATNSFLSDTALVDRLNDQRNATDNFNQNHGLQLRYTEPVGERGQLQVAVEPAIRLSDAEKLTYDTDPDDGEEQLNARLSNKALNTVRSLKGGLSYRFRGEGFMFNLGLDGQASDMHSEQTYPFTSVVDRSYMNLLPNAMFNRNWSKLTRLRVMYRTNVSTPSINQLQAVVDNSDPLHLTTGNLGLDQTYSHALTFRFNTIDSTGTKPFFALLSLQGQRGRVSNVTYAAAADSVLADGMVLPAGAQLTLPMNMDGYLSARALASYGLPVLPVRSNLNLSVGGSVDRLPGMVNGVRNFTLNNNANLGVVLGSNISKDVDFNVGYTANFNTTRSGLRPNAHNAYYQGRLTGSLTLGGLGGWVLENQVNYEHYNGLGADYDRDALVWNAAIGRKFLKNDALELRVTAYDILGRNVSVTRDVTDTYILNTATNMLQRYFLLSLRHNLRVFKAGSELPLPEPERGPGRRPWDGER